MPSTSRYHTPLYPFYSLAIFFLIASYSLPSGNFFSIPFHSTFASFNAAFASSVIRFFMSPSLSSGCVKNSFTHHFHTRYHRGIQGCQGEKRGGDSGYLVAMIGDLFV